MGIFRPTPQVCGMHAAIKPAPPGVLAVRVVPLSVPMRELLTRIETGALLVVTPFSSVMSASMVLVPAAARVWDSVGDPAASPLRWSTMLTGRQLLKFVAGEVTVPTLAMIPVNPGAFAVASPLASTEATAALFCVQPIAPTELVMSLELGAQKPVESGGWTWLEQACALNVKVCLTEKQAPVVGPSTTIEVTTGCTAIWMGALLTFSDEAVIVAVPTMALPCESLPLHTTKVESHTPPQTSPPGETVAVAVFEELNVKVGAGLLSVPPEELVAPTCNWTTSP